MAAPIPPSLAQILQTPPTPGSRPSMGSGQSVGKNTDPAPSPGSFVSALAAQRAFFQQVTAPKITPATYTAKDVAQGTPSVTAQNKVAPSLAPGPSSSEDTQPLKRPGSYINIVI